MLLLRQKVAPLKIKALAVFFFFITHKREKDEILPFHREGEFNGPAAVRCSPARGLKMGELEFNRFSCLFAFLLASTNRGARFIARFTIPSEEENARSIQRTGCISRKQGRDVGGGGGTGEAYTSIPF